MNPRLHILFLLVTFLENMASLMVQRGIYFFTKEELGYSDAMNLYLALLLAVPYVAAALMSHQMCQWLSEKWILIGCVVLQILLHGTLGVFAGGDEQVLGYVIMGSMFVLGLTYGMKWPIVESYISAGVSGESQAAAVGRFNICWSISLPIGLLMVGPLIAWWPAVMFGFSAVMNCLVLMMLLVVPKRPRHLEGLGEELRQEDELQVMRTLLVSSRWLMVLSYVLMFLLFPLLPGIFKRLEVEVQAATALTALLDLIRFMAFVYLQRTLWWHGKKWTLWLSIVMMPAGFGLMVWSPNIAVLVVGEVLLAVSTAVVYYAALYYAMLLHNASVEAGGEHEGFIGGGLVLGPAVGLLGMVLAGPMGSPITGVLVASSPVVLIGSLAAAMYLWKAWDAGRYRDSAMDHVRGQPEGLGIDQ